MSIHHSQLAVAKPQAPQTPNASAPATIEVPTRFGTYEVEHDKLIYMERGLLGFSQSGNFVLLDIPGQETQAFRLYQSVDEPSIAFIVLPLAGDLAQDAEADLQAVCDQRHLHREDAVFLLIATLHPKSEGGLDITVNRRAPVLVDTQRMIASQVVLNDSRYEVQFKL